MLALLLAMGGAWAQQEVLLTTVTPTSLTTYDETTPGIVTVTVNMPDYSGANWGWCQSSQDGTGTITVEAAEGYTITRCVFKQNPSGTPDRVLEDDLVPFVMTVNMYQAESQSWVDKDGGRVYGGFMTGASVIEVYGYANAPAEIKLTKTGDNQWTLDETPDYDLDLNVVYYQKFALKEIPANWQVKVDGVDKTAAIDHDSLMITETAQVLLTPDHPERVKKVILVDEAVLVNIDGITLDITGCTTWAQIIARNSSVLEDYDGSVAASGRGVLDLGGNEVLTSHPYDPAQRSNYHWQLQ